MKIVSRKGLIFGMMLLLSIWEINGAHVRRKRQTRGGGKGELNWQTILKDVQKIPLIGESLQKGLVNLGEEVKKLDQLTNGALSRVAGGYLPCTINLFGIRCVGKPKNGGIVGIARELVNGTMLPKIAKTMIINFLDAAIFPLFDVIFGVPVISDGNM